MTDEVTPEQPKFDLLVYKTLDTSQKSHGVPHDYAQYRKYCTNRLSRLRHTGSVQRHLSKSSKYSSAVKRKHGYNKRELILGDIFHENILLEQLVSAERCWAWASELQASQADHHLVQRKFNKAQVFAQNFCKMTEIAGTPNAILEGKSYLRWTQANACLERKDYQQAYEHYQASTQILSDLIQQNPGESLETLTLRDLWSQRVEDLRPLIRYSAYEAQLTPHDDEDGAVTQQEASSEISLEFAGKTVALDSFKELALQYLKLEPTLQDTSGLDEGQRYTLVSDLESLLDLCRVETKKYEKLSQGPAVQAKMDDLQVISKFLEYQRRSCWQTIHQARKVPSTIGAIRMFGLLQENAQAAAELVDDEDDELRILMESEVLRFRALRCHALAQYYEPFSPQECLSLVEHTETLIRLALEELQACDANTEVSEASLLDIRGDLEILKCRVTCTIHLERLGEWTPSSQRPTWMGGDQVSTAATFIPMPPKPVFYDIALSQVTDAMPTLQVAVAEYVERQTPKKKSWGWF